MLSYYPLRFHQLTTQLQPINGSYITLIPKKQNPTMVTDFRPISLMNCSVKIISKILANRLQPIIRSLIHKNQYSFIKGHSIQDCVAWALEFTHKCKTSKQETLILKLDFTKAFDTVEHSTILFMMHHLGLPQKWIKWSQAILSLGFSSILLNGTPGKFFQCKRGVRQGDPLSPLLFVLTIDLLQHIINRAAHMGIIQAPKCHPPDMDFPIIQYVDDTISFLQADQKNTFLLRGLINTFSQSNGLKVNFRKSSIIPINVQEERASLLAKTFGCSIGSFPFQYLGLPLGPLKPKFKDFNYLMENIERRLSSTSTWLSMVGRLQIVNDVISSLPTYTMCTFKLPSKVIYRIDQARRNFLWCGLNINAGSSSRVA
ncbi:hypothetical protein GUJ93_ZPchr0013g37985 [Zizania palustris]|uniref:Reverse transcriptase domain-containing protein n=1 Tax=Zizania palustris TaxID=103762 RepID=A0A8J5X479_ZIZPA|nr:hypothetical protein GUJ93_ZPchr0013g37985 [Zizania palustris]